MSDKPFECAFCGEMLESAGTKHTIADCAYHLKAALAEAQGEREVFRHGMEVEKDAKLAAQKERDFAIAECKRTAAALEKTCLREEQERAALAEARAELAEIHSMSAYLSGTDPQEHETAMSVAEFMATRIEKLQYENEQARAEVERLKQRHTKFSVGGVMGQHCGICHACVYPGSTHECWAPAPLAEECSHPRRYLGNHGATWKCPDCRKTNYLDEGWR